VKFIKDDDSRAYMKVALLSAGVSLLVLAGLIYNDCRTMVDLLLLVAQQVTIKNWLLARELCEQNLLTFFVIQFLSLAPTVAILAPIVCCFFLRAFGRSFKRPTKSEYLLSLLPAPMIAVCIFVGNPHQNFQIPFDLQYWRSASVVLRGRLVPWLVSSFKFQNLSTESLTASLGQPDFEGTGPGGTSYVGYRTYKGNSAAGIYFYFDKNGKATRCDTSGPDTQGSITY